MSYALEQKREALQKGELWWRFPNELGAGDRAWSLCGCGISSSEAEYHIGPTAPTPPRVLSELEGELLEELKYLVEVAESAMRAANRDGGEYDIGEMLQSPLAAIQKAEAT